MKTLAELQQIREEVYKRICMRHQDVVKAAVVVGIPSVEDDNARAVAMKFVEELHAKDIYDATVTLTACNGEPSTVTVSIKGGEKAVYANITPEMVEQIIDGHIVGGKPVAQYTI